MIPDGRPIRGRPPQPKRKRTGNMPIPSITPPTARHTITLNLDAVRQSAIAADQLKRLEEQPSKIITETEASRRADLRERLTGLLHEQAELARASEITLALHGLNSSAWNQTVIMSTETVDGRPVKDLDRLLKTALPRMCDHIERPDGTTSPVTSDELTGLIDHLADSQTMELLTLIQELNTPATGLPKEVTSLLG